MRGTKKSVCQRAAATPPDDARDDGPQEPALPSRNITAGNT
jgi:hypothetical protein